MNRAERSGRGVRVHFDYTEGAYELTCSNATSLTKANGGRYLDQRPACTIPFYLDGRYEENVETEVCIGCDYVACQPFPPSMGFDVLEYVQTGVRPAPDDGAGGESGAGGSPPDDIADVVSRPYPGPYALTIRYYTDATCRGPLIERPRVTFSLATDGDGGAAGSGD